MGYTTGTKWTYKLVKKHVENLGYELLSKEFRGTRYQIIIKDKEGYLYTVIFGKLIYKNNHILQKFHKNNPYTITNIKLWLKLNNKNFELLSDTYFDNRENLKWKCLKCGEEFETSWRLILRGQGCSFCAGKKVGIFNCLIAKNPELAKEWHPTKNENLTPKDISIWHDKKVWWKCKKCGHEWDAKVSKRNSGTGCPKCNISKGEKTIEVILKKFNTLYDSQYTFKNLKGKNGLLRFDFVLLDYKNNIKLIIEYDGEQHFRPVRFGGTSEEESMKRFKEIITHDIKKNLYCANNNIPLLRIPYWEYDNIEYILTDWLNDTYLLAS